MSEQIFENDNNENEKAPLIVNSPEPIKKKPKKARKPMSEERRKILLANLQKGRETAKLNRQRAAMAKKIIKNKKKTEIEKVIEDEIFEKSNRPNLEEEIKQLKESIKEIKSSKKPKEQSQEEKEEITRLKEEIKLLKENNKKSEENKPVSKPKSELPKPEVQQINQVSEPVVVQPPPKQEPVVAPKSTSPGPPVQIFQQTTRKRRSYWSTLS